MLREAPPAATGTTGRTRATPELHVAVRSGTAGCRHNGDHWPRVGSDSSTHAHLGTAGRETLWEPLATSGQEVLRDLERIYASTHAHLGTTGRGTRGRLPATSGQEELRDFKLE